jgi:hypothetical protein
MRSLHQHELTAVSGGATPAHAKGGQNPNNGKGNGGHDGIPGKSGKEDGTR